MRELWTPQRVTSGAPLYTKDPEFKMQAVKCAFAALATAVLFAGCGGSDKGGSTPAPIPQRGQLLQSPPTLLASYSVTDLLAKLAVNDAGKLLLQLAYTPKCAIDVYHLEHETVGGPSEPTA